MKKPGLGIFAIIEVPVNRAFFYCLPGFIYICLPDTVNVAIVGAFPVGIAISDDA